QHPARRGARQHATRAACQLSSLTLDRLLRDHGYRFQQRCAEGGGHRNVARVATASDEHPPFTPHVVARIECPPAITQITLHPGGEVHRKLKGRDLDLGQIAEHLTSGDIERAAERNREVCEVPADSITAGMYIC